MAMVKYHGEGGEGDVTVGAITAACFDHTANLPSLDTAFYLSIPDLLGYKNLFSTHFGRFRARNSGNENTEPKRAMYTRSAQDLLISHT